MEKILGLDLGTASIGWAVVEQSKDNRIENNKIVECGVRVNPLTADESKNFGEGKAIETNSTRTLKRGARRRLQRYKQRKKSLKELLIKSNILQETTRIAETEENSTLSLIKLRAQSAEQQINIADFGRVLLNLNKKRGYKSNRKANNSEVDGTAVNEIELAKMLVEKNITPGEYVLSIFKQKTADKISTKLVPQFYRSDLQAEFDTIWKKQQGYYPIELNEKLYESLKSKTKKTSESTFKISGIETVELKGKREEKLFQEYLWRAEAIKKKLELGEIAYILSDINGKISSSSGYLGEISDRSKVIHFENKTVGEWKYDILSKDKNTSLRNRIFYRQDYLDEFDKIWSCQSQFYPNILSPELKNEVKGIIFFQRRLKSQKHLVSICELENREITASNGQKKFVGLRACSKSSPLFQEIKILQVLNNLELTELSTNAKRRLTDREREIVFSELNYKDKLTNDRIFKILGISKKNYETNYPNGLDGNRTNASIYKAFQTILEIEGYNITERWDSQLISESRKEISDIFQQLGINTDILEFDGSTSGEAFEKQSSYQLWHLLYSTEEPNSISEEDRSIYGNQDVSLKKVLCSRYGFTPQHAGIIAGTVVLQQDFGNLSTKALRKIYPYLRDGKIYSEACELAGYNHSSSMTKEDNANRELRTELALLPKGSLRNPVVEKIINQMINVVNGLNELHGPFDRINIELARELKSSQKERDAMTKGINAANKRHGEIREILRKEPFYIKNPTKNDIIRYKLFEELSCNASRTLYSNTPIKKQDLFSNVYDIEHIIPKTLIYDDSFSNKTIELKRINQKKSDKTALDFVEAEYGENELEQYKSRVIHLYKSGKINKAKRDKLLMSKDTIESNFIERDLRNTQYISKKALEILSHISRDVLASSGHITDVLRREWGLIDTLKEINMPKYKAAGRTIHEERKGGQMIEKIVDWSKRNDHRHHAMDAITVAFTKRSHIKYLNTLSANSSDNTKRSDIFASPLPDIRAKSREALESILVSVKAKNKVATRNKNTPKVKGEKGKSKIQLTPRAQLHLETIYGRRIEQSTEEVKVGSNFSLELAEKVCKPTHKEALLKRLAENNNDAKKAFTGKNSPSKNPIYIDNNKTKIIPEKVRINVQKEVYTIKKAINPDLKVENVWDIGIKRKLEERLAQYNRDKKQAFSNLEENPIWLNEEAGIAIKKVLVKTTIKNPEPLHSCKDLHGNTVIDETGKEIPCDFVQTSNNHHVAIYEDEKGKWQDVVVSYFEAIARVNMGLPIVDKNHNAELGWKFKFTMKRNEMFIIPKDGFVPDELDLLDPINASLISPYLFRVQQLSSRDYTFSHHLETQVTNNTQELKLLTYYSIRSNEALKKLIKLRIDNLGHIVHVGEY
ncbi:MAG: type II CRISPR RNA-guided endonuclease Cas9 [Bacteroidales bacterium]